MNDFYFIRINFHTADDLTEVKTRDLDFQNYNQSFKKAYIKKKKKENPLKLFLNTTSRILYLMIYE